VSDWSVMINNSLPAEIERAHQAAVNDALAFIEQHALFTRTGPHGIRQVNVRGLVATAFTRSAPAVCFVTSPSRDLGRAVHRTARHRPGEAADPGRSSVSTRD
jgi:hypothetical protein